MSILSKTGLGTAAIAVLVSSALPAAAGWGGGHGWNSWGGGYGHGWRKHRRGDDDTAEVLGGVLLGAILVGAISSASKKAKRERAEGYPERDERYGRNDGNRDGSRDRNEIASEDQAVDACAMAAESRAGRSASVRDIDQVRRSGEGWDVEGIVETRDSWRDRSGERRRFTCSVRYGSVDSIYVEDAKVAFAD